MTEKAMVQSGVYTITNATSGKVYVGSTVNFRRRWKNHRYYLRHSTHSNSYLQRAWDKYGQDTFEFLVCEYVGHTEQLHVHEQYWLDFHRMFTEVYNYGTAARSPRLGLIHTEATKHKMGISRRARAPASEEARRRMSEAHKGNNYRLGCKHTTETRRKIGETLGRPYPAFINRYTGEVIPAGVNLHALDRERGLDQRNMQAVKSGKCRSHKGWMLLSEHCQPRLL